MRYSIAADSDAITRHDVARQRAQKLARWAFFSAVFVFVAGFGLLVFTIESSDYGPRAGKATETANNLRRLVTCACLLVQTGLLTKAAYHVALTLRLLRRVAEAAPEGEPPDEAQRRRDWLKKTRDTQRYQHGPRVAAWWLVAVGLLVGLVASFGPASPP